MSPRPPEVTVLEDVLLLDAGQRLRPGTIGAYLIPHSGSTFSLVECAAVSTLPELEGAIRSAGFELAGLRHLLVTHIHLDHAGAAGTLARRTGALVHVHHRGAPHLEDPRRLVESARRVYGTAFDEMWGGMDPVPRDQLRPLYDGDTVRLPGKEIEVLETPGHASHHVSFLLNDDTLFTGDAAGVRFPPAELIRPALPPPETDLETWQASLAKMRATVPERLLLTHFGEVRDADEHLARVAERNREWAQVALEGLRRGEDIGELTARISRLEESEFEAEALDPSTADRYRVSSDASMTAMGLSRYWSRLHPEALGR